ncbi:MAG TPA: lytic transglycosylase F, partial [Porphyromonadaceae bacterium]|nr:lytic transglycosylase F [Porphyromonadaceae bacterium]
LFVFILLLLSCNRSKEAGYDFPQIAAKDTLRVITLNTSTSYFIYRDQEMGYHYEMIKSFADEHGLELQV